MKKNITVQKKQTKSNNLSVRLTLMLCTVCLCFAAGCGKREPVADFIPEDGYIRQSSFIDYDISSLNMIPNNSFPTLSVPTYITKVEDTYFIVDCYHNQIIYHDNLTDPLYLWQVMTSEVSMPHTLASDGFVYVIDDTENNRVLVMEKGINENGQPVFLPTQEFTGIGNRPHYAIYDEATKTFYVWSSQNGEMYLFRRPADSTTLYLTEIRTIPSLADVYVRSFTIIDDNIYFVAGIGSSSIIEADLDTFQVKKEYPVPDEIAGMVQLTLIEDYYYITVSTDSSGSQDYATMIRVKDLKDLEKGNYEDVYSNFIGGGTPYYITSFDDTFYLTEHRLPGHSIWSFKVTDNTITDAVTIY
ncbi:MAG: hypothetical protein ACI4ED_01810 [Suilimivivens sp.]